MSKFENVSVVKKANVYFDGKCISHTLYLSDGSRKTVGVMFPSKLTFNTAEPELVEITAGSCRVKLADDKDWHVYRAGDRFKVAAHSAFDIEPLETLDYVCHFG